MDKLKWTTVTKRIGELIPYGKNPRRLTDKQYDDLKQSLIKFSLAEIPVIDFDNTIIAGHMRLKVLAEIESPDFEVDVRVPNRKLTEKEFQEYNIRSNKNTGEFDFDILANEFEIEDLIDWGFEEEELVGFADEEEPTGEEDATPAKPEIPRSQLGDLYELGNHRVLCGDSTDKEIVAVLMDGDKADVVYSDPPYGMGLNADWSGAKSRLDFAEAKNSFGGKKHNNVIGDHKDFKPELITTVFNNFDYCKEVFMWGADYYAELLQGKNDGSWVVWDKRLEDSADKMYGSCFELCWSKARHKRDIARVKWARIFGTEKEFDHKRYHPTQKPIALTEWFFDKWCEGLNLCVDLYLGAGGVLIACEKTKRRCYGMELDPVYVDVIVQRYVDYTGNNKIKLNGEAIEWSLEKS